MRESPTLKRILLKCSRGASRLFRNNVGAYQDKDGRWIRYGVAGKGGSDLIGWRSITIGPEHLGRKVAIFCAIEVKGAGGRPSKEQLQFIEQVRKAGGIAGIARSEDEALEHLESLDI